ncbi:phosphoglycolate phosphatase-like HAD superfamily hydrolase [Salegentibacter sp. 24]|uniref:HAD family hydrolase n=1 Tax=Salegentibacter sp. 24 TaxID=2183986 RepID=UPI00105B8817|nr:HAD hydrolase-like protein [Salegentibacter sp. 24]TDN82168.1 phosphoglycolate phosphatase-like HAD superfamily hydrolase [Salegentibacter sp. 24]
MIGFTDKAVILWDFDGVILNSMPVREYGFKQVLEKYPEEQIEQLLAFHRENGGLSRYVKFRYFFEAIRAEALSDEKLKTFTDRYSSIMRNKLCSRENLIAETISFIEQNYKKYTMHIVSGSDGKELRYLCEQLNISQYFKTIWGSPTPKIELVSNLIREFSYDPTKLCLIGDSKNDMEAAASNNLVFYGFNNENLNKEGKKYISSFF